MVDVDDARLADGLKRASDVVMSRIKIGRATPQDMANMLALLNTSTSTKLFADCRRGDRGDHRERGGQERRLQRAGRRDSRRRHPGEQHLDDLDHAHGRVCSSSRAVRRHALLQSGRSDGAGRGDPGRKDQRRDGRDDRRTGQADSQDADRRQGLCGLPGESRAVSVHERVVDLARRRGVGRRRSTGRPPSSACRWAR